jgi:hypothetical protein
MTEARKLAARKPGQKNVRKRVRCSSLVDWPVYLRLRLTMQNTDAQSARAERDRVILRTERQTGCSVAGVWRLLAQRLLASEGLRQAEETLAQLARPARTVSDISMRGGFSSSFKPLPPLV